MSQLSEARILSLGLSRFVMIMLLLFTGANQIIQLAIETLRKELPPQPPSVNELRRSESLAKQQLVSAARLEATRNRGKPFSEGAGGGKVGKL